MTDELLFREVDEEVRQEQYKKIWSQYGNIFIALCLLIVLGVAGYKGWQYWQKTQAEAASVVFFQAVANGNAGKSEEALKEFESIGHTGYAQLAKLREAGVLAASGKTDEAIKLYDTIAASAGTAAPLRDLARLRAAYVSIDSASFADISARVKDFDAAGNPWRHMAREILMLSAFKAGDHAGADSQAQAILGDPEAPAPLRQRAGMIADLLLPIMGQK